MAELEAFHFLLPIIGAVAGLMAGLLGIGGGIIIVPGLYYIFTHQDIPAEIRMHMAVGSSLAIIILTGSVSAFFHYRRGAVDGEILRILGPAVFAGALAGSGLARYIAGPVLTLLFAVLAFAVALKMGLGARTPVVTRDLPGPAACTGLGVAIGAISALLGIGGGSLTVPALSTFSVPVRRAVGTAAAVGVILAVPGTAGFVLSGQEVAGLPKGSAGYVHLPAVGLIAATSLIAARSGVHLAHALPADSLRRGFAIFLMIAAIKLFYDAIGPIA